MTILEYSKDMNGWNNIWIGDSWGGFHTESSDQIILDGEFSIQNLKDIIETLESYHKETA